MENDIGESRALPEQEIIVSEEEKQLVSEIATDPRMTSWTVNGIRNILITSSAFDLLGIFNKNLPRRRF